MAAVDDLTVSVDECPPQLVRTCSRRAPSPDLEARVSEVEDECIGIQAAMETQARDLGEKLDSIRTALKQLTETCQSIGSEVDKLFERISR